MRGRIDFASLPDTRQSTETATFQSNKESLGNGLIYKGHYLQEGQAITVPH